MGAVWFQIKEEKKPRQNEEIKKDWKVEVRQTKKEQKEKRQKRQKCKDIFKRKQEKKWEKK